MNYNSNKLKLNNPIKHKLGIQRVQGWTR